MTLEEAIALAARAHAKQIDKAGKPYVLHVLRVMMAVPDDAKIAAVLHDIVEDTDTTINDLRAAGVCEEDLVAIELLTYKKALRAMCIMHIFERTRARASSSSPTLRTTRAPRDSRRSTRKRARGSKQNMRKRAPR